MYNDPSTPGVEPQLAPVVPSVRWGAIFASALVAVGVWFLLHVLGMSVGLIAIEPYDTSSLRGVGIGAGVWSMIAPILALFVGGLVVGRLTGPLSRLTGAIHGAVVWSLTTVASIAVVWFVATALLGSAISAGGQVVAATASGAAQVVGEADLDSFEALGLSANDLLAPVNQRLAAEGRPPVSAEQLTAAAKDALRASIREERLDRDIFVNSLADKTALSRDDAAAIAGTVQQRYDARIAQLGEMRQRAEQTALEVAEGAGKALLGLFFALLLGLAAAVTGATLSVRHEQRRAVRDTRGIVPPGGAVPAH